MKGKTLLLVLVVVLMALLFACGGGDCTFCITCTNSQGDSATDCGSGTPNSCSFFNQADHPNCTCKVTCPDSEK